MHKPRDQEEILIIDHMRKYPNDRREYRSTKRKKERYNRIISIIIATKV
jgi:hypothetical protein